MIKIKIADIDYQVMNEWKDLTPSILHCIKSMKPIDLIPILSDIPKNVIERLSDQSLLSIYQIVSFIEESPPGLTINKPIDVASESWKNLELAKEALKTQSPPFLAVEISGIYFGEDVLNWPINLVYGQTYQILESLNVFLNRYKDLSDSEPYDDDQLEAGVKGLETFGVGAIRYSLAKGDPTKYDKIESMKAEDVYFTLLYEKGVNEYQKRLKGIYDRQNGISSRKNSNGNT